MKRKTMALVGIVVGMIAFVFLAPVVPFNKTIYTGLQSPQVPTSPRCSNPLNLSGNALVNPALLYHGYESAVYYFSGIGVMFYTECAIL